MALDLQKSALYATLAGLGTVALHYTLNASTDFYSQGQELDREGVKKMLKDMLIGDLKESFSIDPLYGEDGILT